MLEVMRFADLIHNKYKLAKFVAYMIPIYKYYGTELPRQNVICPFHNDSSPSAKLFIDESDGISRLYCHACRKQFTSYDYIKDVLHRNPVLYLREMFPDAEQLDKDAVNFDRDVWEDGPLEEGDNWHELEKDLLAVGTTAFLDKYYKVKEDNYASR